MGWSRLHFVVGPIVRLFRPRAEWTSLDNQVDSLYVCLRVYVCVCAVASDRQFVHASAAPC